MEIFNLFTVGEQTRLIGPRGLEILRSGYETPRHNAMFYIMYPGKRRRKGWDIIWGRPLRKEAFRLVGRESIAPLMLLPYPSA